MDINNPATSAGTVLTDKRQKAFAFVGLVLLLTGLIATGMAGQFNVITIILCLLGLLVGSVIFLPRFTRNLGVYTNMAVYSFFFMAAAIVFFLILQKHPVTFDATRAGNFSLSPVTINFMERLDTRVRATAFLVDKSERTAAALTLGEYSRHSPNFEYRTMNPYVDANLARSYGSAVMPGDVYLEKLTSNTQEVEPLVVKVNDLNEEQLTNGIIQLLRGEYLTLYFTQGHGEPALEEDKVKAVISGNNIDPDNLVWLRDQLEQTYTKSVPIDLSRRNQVPVDADALIIVAPEQDFSAAEIQTLRNYLSRGGRAMFLVNSDPAQVGGGKELRTTLTNLSALMAEFGIEMPSAVVVRPLARQSGEESIFIAPAASKPHRITGGKTSEQAIVFEQARPLRVLDSPPAEVFTEVFLATPPDAWPLPIEELRRALVRREQPKSPRQGDLRSLPLGIASTRQPANTAESAAARIVVIGNGNFITNRFVDGNGWLLFMNGINWLTNTGDLIAIPTAEVENTPAILTPRQKQFLFILMVVAVPAIIGLGGLGYSISRRGGLA